MLYNIPFLLLAPALTTVKLWSVHLPSRSRGRRYEGGFLTFTSPPSCEIRRHYGGAFTSYKVLEFRAEETQGPSTSLSWASSLFVVDDGAAMRNLDTCWCIVSAIIGSISCKYKRHRHCATAVVRVRRGGYANILARNTRHESATVNMALERLRTLPPPPIQLPYIHQ